MRNFRNCKYCGNLYRKKNGLDKNGKGRRVWKMILGFPIYALLGGLGKSELDAAAFGGDVHGRSDNNIFFHSIYCSQSCYLAAKEQKDLKDAEKAQKKAIKEQKKAEKKSLKDEK